MKQRKSREILRYLDYETLIKFIHLRTSTTSFLYVRILYDISIGLIRSERGVRVSHFIFYY